jgi:hypothetical protein
MTNLGLQTIFHRPVMIIRQTCKDLSSNRNFKEMRELVSQISIQNPLGFMNAMPAMNLRFASYGTTLGFKGHICEKCLSFEIVPILDDEKMTSLKSNHMCSTQSVDTTGTIMYKRKHELIFCLIFIVNYMAKQQELVDLTAVEIPASVFDSRLDSYEEYVDLDSLPSRTISYFLLSNISSSRICRKFVF